MIRKQASLLIVEDNVLDRECYERFLARNAEYDFDIDHCEMGDDALAICRRNPPDCILLDYHLPDIDGIEFLLAIQNERPGGVMPAVVMITSQGASSVAVDAIRHGANDYLVKSDIDEARLNRVIPNALKARHGAAHSCIKKHTILVVDDSAHDRELYKRLLQETSHSRFDFIEVASGNEALVSVSVHRPDCILLDYNLPDYDGLELLEALHYEYIKHGLAAPVILMLTGQGSESHAVASIKNGANDYLVKGEITREVLKQSVVSTLEIRSLQKKLQEVRKEHEAFSDAVSHSLDAVIRGSLESCELVREEVGVSGDVVSASFENVCENLKCLQNFSRELADIRQASLQGEGADYCSLMPLVENVIASLKLERPALAVEVTGSSHRKYVATQR